MNRKIFSYTIISCIIIIVLGRAFAYESFEQYKKFIVIGNKIQLIDIQGDYSKEDSTQYSVQSVAFAPNGKKAITGQRVPGNGYYEGGLIKLWAINDEGVSEIKRLEGHLRAVNSVSFSSDGSTAISTSNDGTVRIWDIATDFRSRILKKVVTAKYNLAWAAAFTQDADKTLVAINENYTLKLLDVNTGREIKKFNIDWNIKDISVACDGKLALSVSPNDSLCIWDIERGMLLKKLKRQSGWLPYIFGSTGVWTCGDLSQDGKLSVGGSSDGKIRLWDVLSGKEIWCKNAHLEGINDISFSPNGKFVLSAGGDDKIKLWNIKGDVIDVIDLSAVDDTGKALSLSPDSASFLVGTNRGVILYFRLLI